MRGAVAPATMESGSSGMPLCLLTVPSSPPWNMLEARSVILRSGLIQSRKMRREHYASAYIVHASVIPLLTHRRKIGEETDDLQGSFERTPDFPDNE